MPQRLNPGSFGSLTDSCIERLLSMLGEVLEALHRLSARASDDGQGGVADCRQHLWGGAGAGSALILTTGNVAHVMQAVLDAPMAARDSQQRSGVGDVGREAGDGVDRLDAFDPTH